MRLTTFSDYTLRVLIYLGVHDEKIATVGQIAEAYGISANHLMKVVHYLAQGGYIETARGKGGGMRLAAAPADINLGAVVRSIEPDFFLVDCFGSDTVCLLAGSCQLTSIVSGALQVFMQHLDRHTLADLLPAPGDSASRLRPVTFGKRPARVPT